MTVLKELQPVEVPPHGFATGWRTEKCCVNCNAALGTDAIYYNNGRCPCCGYRDPGACTITATYSVPYREAYTAPAWKFWKPTRRVYATPDSLPADSLTLKT